MVLAVMVIGIVMVGLVIRDRQQPGTVQEVPPAKEVPITFPERQCHVGDNTTCRTL